MSEIGVFPFGEPVLPVEQADRSPKQVFVLGVYASAVHACWIGNDERVAVQALAVRSEPYIFWRGEDVESLIADIDVPEEAGWLVPAAHHHNGPSGQALDDQILGPLGFSREESWLCDLVPYYLANDNQLDAIEKKYKPIARDHSLPTVTVPPRTRIHISEARQEQILSELTESNADILILLGDEPIRWFLSAHSSKWRKLADFGTSPDSYGLVHGITISGRNLQVLPVAHPRQIAKLGRHSPRWHKLHESWQNETAPYLLR